MSHANQDPQAVGRPIGLVRLVENGSNWLAVPPRSPAPGEKPFHPFVLPRIPESMLHWLTLGAQRVWRQHERCLAALLLVSTSTGRWTLRLPRQHCGPYAACWTTLADDLPGLSADMRLAGSYQSRVVAPGDDAADTVPRVDGVHLVQGVRPAGPPWPLWTFVRVARIGARDVRPDRVVANDWAEAVDEAMPRLRFA